MKKTTLLIVATLVAYTAYSQTPDPFPTWQKDLVRFISALVIWVINNWDDVLGLAAAFLVSLQALLRVIPTKHNYDFLSLWIEWLNERIPNRSKDGGVFRTTTTKEVDK